MQLLQGVAHTQHFLPLRAHLRLHLLLLLLERRVATGLDTDMPVVTDIAVGQRAVRDGVEKLRVAPVKRLVYEGLKLLIYLEALSC